jgi:hypothetical protein
MMKNKHHTIVLYLEIENVNVLHLQRLVPGGPLEGMAPETYSLIPKKN